MYKIVAEQNCISFLDLCNSVFKLTQIHAKLVKTGLANNPLVLTKFTSVSSNLNAVNYACSLIFSPESNPKFYDTFLFNTVIKSYAETAQSKLTSIRYYSDMINHGIVPNNYTYSFVFKACAGIGDLKLGKVFHGVVMKIGFIEDTYVSNSMIHMYCNCVNGIEYAEKAFDKMSNNGSVSWSTMIGGYVKWGMSTEAVKVFRKMQIVGVLPDQITLVSVLSACASLGALELGRWVESYIVHEKLTMNVLLNNALIDMYAKCGDCDKSLNLFRNMLESKRTIISWTSVIVGLAMHGRGVEAVTLFEEMSQSGIVPDDVAFIGLLSACSHSGLVEEGKRYFNSMVKDYNILPKIEHCGCMVDLLSRAGLVKEAMDFIRTMPMKPNPVIWRILINACRAHGELDIGERITKDLILSDPVEQSNYVLLSSIHAKKAEWEKKISVREGMVKKGIRKVPGSSMIEFGDGIYEFVAGDKSHSEYAMIYEMVDEMEKKMRAFGYVAETSNVLLDVDEEDKEGAVNKHSEKLAIAFALLKTPRGTRIRIVKNLRVCGDCHSATKMISMIYKREIVVRDRSRFHHFKDGLCSCKDFW